MKPTTKIRRIVREVLEDDDKARSDDRWLIYLVWRRYTNIYIDYHDFKKLPHAETITRLRREFNSNGLFLPDNPRVLKRRMLKERHFREYYGKKKNMD
jgi:hypothetical protein